MRNANKTIREHERRIRALAYPISICGADVEDLIQEGRLALWHAMQTFDENRGTQLWTYARIFVVGAMLETRAKAVKESKFVSQDWAHSLCQVSPSHEGAVAAREILRIALDRISDDDLEVILLRFEQEKDLRSIAGELGVCLGQAHKLVTCAVASMKERAA